jgi:hypothetical protein
MMVAGKKSAVNYPHHGRRLDNLLCLSSTIHIMKVCSSLISVLMIQNVKFRMCIVCPTEVFGPSNPLQLAGVNMKVERICVYIVAVLSYVLF